MAKIWKPAEVKGFNRCSYRRQHEISLEPGKKYENVYKKAAFIHNTIQEQLHSSKKMSEEEMDDFVKEAFKEFDYPTEWTRNLHALSAAKQIWRRVSSEHRLPIFCAKKIIPLCGLLDVEGRPDNLFVGTREFERTMLVGKKKVKYTATEPYIEATKDKCKAPDVTLTGRNKDTGAMQNLELFFLYEYAKAAAEELGLEKKGLNIIGSFYFLRKNSDSSAKDSFDTDFFHGKGGGNIVSLSSQYDDLTIEANFAPQIRSFINGESVCGSACDRCDFRAVCAYTKPPVAVEQETKQRHLQDLTLSEQQEECVGFREGIARINAGAGAGKTVVVALRTAYLLDEGVSPEKILLITFTNTGAQEMRERIQLYVDDLGCDVDLSKLTITTFNAFGDAIVKENYEKLGFKNAPGILDEILKSSIVAKLLKKTRIEGLDYKNFYSRMPSCMGALPMTSLMFSILKTLNKGSYSEELEMDVRLELGRKECFIGPDTIKETFDLYLEYTDILREKCLLEYADQELLIFELLKENPFYFEEKGFAHIMVDEFQDSNEIQFEILKKIIDTPEVKSFMVVGDDSQSIFGFRGSTPEYIVKFFEKLEEKGKDFYLLDNYRSCEPIIDFANALNAKNEHRVVKDLVAKRGPGKPVVVKPFFDKEEMVKEIIDLIKRKRAEGFEYEDIAYIASKRTELLRIGTQLTEEGIPWTMINPEPMMENSRVLAALAYGRLLKDSSSSKDAFEYLNAKEENKLLDNHSDEEIKKMIEELKSHTEEVFKNSDEEAFMEDLKAISADDEIFESFLETISGQDSLSKKVEYMENFSLYGDGEARKRNKKYPGVVLTTAHSSKGLEWPVVINDITNYHTKGLKKERDVEEKRRLFFVSATRARDELYIVGRMVAYGSLKSKEVDERVFNMFMMEACEITGTTYSLSAPSKKK